MKERIIGFDTLRGFAILLMIIDHVAAIIFSMEINEHTIRFFTRLSEPLFILLFGYFLYKRTQKSILFRLIEIMIVAFVINIFFYSLLNVFDILASISVFYILFILIGAPILIFFLSFLFSYFDFTYLFFDYPISIVTMQACIGYFMREARENKQLKSIFYLSLFLFFLTFFFWQKPHSYSIIFTFPALFIFMVFEKYLTNFSIWPLTLFGRYPLASYAIQYIVIVFLAIILESYSIIDVKYLR